MIGHHYQVTKLLDGYDVMRLGAPGLDVLLVRALPVATTPLMALAWTIAGDCGRHLTPADASLFAEKFLVSLAGDAFVSITLKGADIATWIEQLDRGAATGQPEARE